jgi:hypothetical protein
MSNHLNHPQMLAYLDGELPKAEMANVADHLHSCWTCRIEMERLEGDIATILDAHNESFAPSIPPPSKAWPTFETLIAHKSTEPRQPMFLRLAAVMRVHLTPMRGFALASLVAGIILFFFLRLGSTTVSAKEAVANIRLAEQRQASVSSGQIVRQRFHVKESRWDGMQRKSDSVAAWKSSRAAVWESSDKHDPTIDSLRREYAASHVAIDLPISAAAFDAWEGIVGGEPSLARDGTRLQIAFHRESTHSGSQPTALSFRVVPSTWHVESMTLQFGDDSFEISEEDLSAIPTSEVPPLLLAELEPPPVPFVMPLVPPRVVSDTSVAIIPTLAINLDQEQLRVMMTLHRLGADLGEPVTVTHSAHRVEVGVWQLPPERQSEIRSALQGDALVTVNSLPPKFQATRTLDSTAFPASPVPARISVPSGDEDQRLLKFFGSAEKEQAFTKEALRKSTEILAHLYALRNLQAQFPPERELELAPSAQSQLDLMVQDHVKLATASLVGLEQQLTPLNRSFAVAMSDMNTAEDGDTKWQNVSIDALSTARAADHLLRDLLTTSNTSSTPDTALPELQEKLTHLSAEMKGLQNK